MGFHADDEFLPQPSGGFGAGVTGHGAAVSAAALHPTGEHGAVSGGAAADGSDARLSSSAVRHQHHGQDRAAARGPAALLPGGSTRGQRRTTDTAQVILIPTVYKS